MTDALRPIDYCGHLADPPVPAGAPMFPVPPLGLDDAAPLWLIAEVNGLMALLESAGDGARIGGAE